MVMGNLRKVGAISNERRSITQKSKVPTVDVRVHCQTPLRDLILTINLDDR